MLRLSEGNLISNHVVEHIEDLNNAFKELRRIGESDCLYAFSVPTNIWLILSIPAGYYGKFRGFCKRFLSLFYNNKVNKSAESDGKIKKSKIKPIGLINKILYVIFPIGHGVRLGFIDCYQSFRIKKWQQLFFDNGFSIIKIQPLLLYAPSELPIIPTTKLFNRWNICSSVLFLMKKTKF